jgi:hypothetical protein
VTSLLFDPNILLGILFSDTLSIRSAEFSSVAGERGLPDSYCSLLAQFRQSDICHEFSNSLIVLEDLLQIHVSAIFAFYRHFRISITTL